MNNNTIKRRDRKEQYVLENREEIELWIQEGEKYYDHRRSPLRAYVDNTIRPALGYGESTHWKYIWRTICHYYKTLSKYSKWIT